MKITALWCKIVFSTSPNIILSRQIRFWTFIFVHFQNSQPFLFLGFLCYIYNNLNIKKSNQKYMFHLDYS